MVRKGSKMAEKTKRKISKATSGRTFSKATKMKMSDAKKGNNHPMYGKHHSEETKRKISKAKKDRRNQESLGVDEHGA